MWLSIGDHYIHYWNNRFDAKNQDSKKGSIDIAHIKQVTPPNAGKLNDRTLTVQMEEDLNGKAGTTFIFSFENPGMADGFVKAIRDKKRPSEHWIIRKPQTADECTQYTPLLAEQEKENNKSSEKTEREQSDPAMKKGGLSGVWQRLVRSGDFSVAGDDLHIDGYPEEKTSNADRMVESLRSTRTGW